MFLAAAAINGAIPAAVFAGCDPMKVLHCRTVQVHRGRARRHRSGDRRCRGAAQGSVRRADRAPSQEIVDRERVVCDSGTAARRNRFVGVHRHHHRRIRAHDVAAPTGKDKAIRRSRAQSHDCARGRSRLATKAVCPILQRLGVQPPRVGELLLCQAATLEFLNEMLPFGPSSGFGFTRKDRPF